MSGCEILLIGDAVEDQAMGVDPLATAGIEAYLLPAEQQGCALTGIIETYIHADHRSLAQDLADLSVGDSARAASRGFGELPLSALTGRPTHLTWERHRRNYGNPRLHAGEPRARDHRHHSVTRSLVWSDGRCPVVPIVDCRPTRHYARGHLASTLPVPYGHPSFVRLVGMILEIPDIWARLPLLFPHQLLLPEERSPDQKSALKSAWPLSRPILGCWRGQAGTWNTMGTAYRRSRNEAGGR